MSGPTYTNIRRGRVARTVEAGDDMHVDVGADNRIIGIETFGGNNDWAQALVRLAITGRLAVVPRLDEKAESNLPDAYDNAWGERGPYA